jgi:uncharacterized protein YecE (DUF72 family)
MELQTLAGAIQSGRLVRHYMYFNNDPEGHAVNNATKLKVMLKR